MRSAPVCGHRGAIAGQDASARESWLTRPVMQPEALFAEVEDLLRTMPPRSQLHWDSADNLAWFGSATAVIEEWNPVVAARWHTAIGRLRSKDGLASGAAASELISIVHQARKALLMRLDVPKSLAVQAGNVFDYYEGLRGIIEQASADILFVDPYLDAEFVSRYLPSVKAGVSIRLLARERISTLMPAVRLFAQQQGAIIEVRSAPNFHDRFVFFDKTACYQSSGSFKDGGKKSPVVIMPLSDALAPLLTTYESIWANGAVQT